MPDLIRAEILKLRRRPGMVARRAVPVLAVVVAVLAVLRLARRPAGGADGTSTTPSRHALACPARSSA